MFPEYGSTEPDGTGLVRLLLAEQATERIRVGVLVLNVPFWNAHLLAREVATVDVLTGGRLELGVGAGHMKWEFDAAGIRWAPHPDRVAAVESALDELERLFAGTGYPERRARDEFYHRPVLAPVQRRGLNLSADEVLATPFLRIGTVAEIVAQLRERRERFGISSITVHKPYMATLAPVIEQLL